MPDPAMRRRLLIIAIFAPLLALTAAHAAFYYWLCDDAYISFRYARNLVAGHGLVFNIGERVEGYTNFLWVLELAGIWKALGMGPEAASVVLSGLYTAGVLALTFLLAMSGPLAGRARLAAAWAALFLLAASRAFAIFTTSGLETRQVAFFLLLALWLLTRRGGSSPWPLVGASLSLAACEYTRPEGMMFAGVVFTGFLADSLILKTFSWRRLACLVAPFALLVGLHFLFRRAYYGEWLPNTFYAKYVRSWPEAGIRYVAMMALENGLYLLAPLALAGAILRLVKRRDSLFILAFALMACNVAYVTWIGGDHFEYRMFDWNWPLLAVGSAEAIAWAALGIARTLESKGSRQAARIGAAIGACGVLITCAYATALQIGKMVVTGRFESRMSTHALTPRITREDVPAAFLLPGMSRIAEGFNQCAGFCNPRLIGATHQEHKIFWQFQANSFRPCEKAFRLGLIPRSAVMSTTAIGIIGFFLPEVTIIDERGLTDHTIARAMVAAANEERHLAHDRQPPPGYLESRGVNFYIYPCRHSPTRTLDANYILKIDEDTWLPFHSEKHEWVPAAFKPGTVLPLQ